MLRPADVTVVALGVSQTESTGTRREMQHSENWRRQMKENKYLKHYDAAMECVRVARIGYIRADMAIAAARKAYTKCYNDSNVTFDQVLLEYINKEANRCQ